MVDSYEMSSTGDRASPEWPISFIQCYEVNFDAFIKMAYLVVQSKEIAEDIVQDTFFKVGNNWGSIEFPIAYTRKAIVHSCNSYFRHKRIEKIFAPRLAKLTLDEPLHTNDLAEFIKKLPRKQRIAIILRFYEDLTDDQIADAIGCNKTAIPSLITRARIQLKGMMTYDK